MIPTEQNFGERLVLYDYSKNERGTTAHYHDHYELYFLHEGQCAYIIENKIHTIFPNNIVIIPPNLIHTTAFYSKRSACSVMSFPRSAIPPAFVTALERFYKHNVYIPQDSGLEHVKDLIGAIGAESHESDDISKESARCYLMLLLKYIIQNSSMPKQSHLISPTSTAVNDMMTYVKENCTSELSLEELARCFGYSTNYISNLFKRTTGIGYKEYLILQRIKLAEEMLLGSDASIRDIAISCGFNDSNYFSTMFKSIKHISPLQFRKMNLERK